MFSDYVVLYSANIITYKLYTNYKVLNGVSIMGVWPITTGGGTFGTDGLGTRSFFGLLIG